jgi:hypothetical protein
MPASNPPEHYIFNNLQPGLSFTHARSTRSTMKDVRVFWRGSVVQYKSERANKEEDEDEGKITKEMT